MLRSLRAWLAQDKLGELSPAEKQLLQVLPVFHGFWGGGRDVVAVAVEAAVEAGGAGGAEAGPTRLRVRFRAALGSARQPAAFMLLSQTAVHEGECTKVPTPDCVGARGNGSRRQMRGSTPATR